ncbi:MAG: hypothetical protein AAGD14_16235 [Planctomycetota bacterium]
MFRRILILVAVLVPFLGTPAAASTVDASLEHEVEQLLDEPPASNAWATENEYINAIFYGEEPDRFILTAGAWWARLKGPVEFSNGAELDVSETFGLRARKFIPFIRAAWRLGWFEITFEGFWYDNNGDQIVATEFELDGVIFEVGDVISSRIRIHQYKLTLGFALIRLDYATLKLQIGAAALYTEGKVRAVNVDAEARWDQWLPLPTIGLALTGYIRYPWLYSVEFGWIGLSTDVFDVNAIDGRVSIGYEFNDYVNLSAGYRYLGIKGDIDAVSVDITLDGFYLELYILF